MGCILADDMGLGKTIQAITLLLALRGSSASASASGCSSSDSAKAAFSDPVTKPPGPALVVAPAGVLGTWEKELQQGSPLKVWLYNGSGRRLPSRPGDTSTEATSPDVVLMSYDTLRLDEEKI